MRGWVRVYSPKPFFDFLCYDTVAICIESLKRKKKITYIRVREKLVLIKTESIYGQNKPENSSWNFTG